MSVWSILFPNTIKVLKNIRESLSEDGRLGISVHGKTQFYESIDDVLREFRIYPTIRSPVRDRYDTKDALREEIEKVGFHDISTNIYHVEDSYETFEKLWKYIIHDNSRKLEFDKLDIVRKGRLERKIRENIMSYMGKDGRIRFSRSNLILVAKR